VNESGGRDHAPKFLRPMLAVAATVGLAVSGFTMVGPALAGPAGAPGVNATVKIHRDEPEPNPEIKNQPHVCTFHVHGFNFDEGETGVWWIQGWPPTGGPPARDPANAVMGPEPYVATEDDGSNAYEWRTTVRTLPDGHYKLFVEQSHTNGSGDTVVTYKHKVFWVECAAVTATPTPTATGTPTPTPTPTGSVAGETSTPTATPSTESSVAGGTGTPGAEQSVQGGTGTPGAVPNTATPSGGTTPMAGLLAMLLLLSIGALGWLNLAAVRRRNH